MRHRVRGSSATRRLLEWREAASIAVYFVCGFPRCHCRSQHGNVNAAAAPAHLDFGVALGGGGGARWRSGPAADLTALKFSLNGVS